MARGGFPGIPGGNMQQLMRQAQKMQQQMMQKQEELDAREYEGTAGGGAVACKLARPIALRYPKTAVGRIAFVGKATGAIGTVLSVISLVITFLIAVFAAVIIIMYVVPAPVVA